MWAFLGRGNWVGLVEGRSLGWGCFRGVEVLGSGFWFGWGV